MVPIQRNVRFGDPRVPMFLWDKVFPQESGCWLWGAYSLPSGYGRLRRNKTYWMAHRFFYASLVRFPESQTLDHLCRERSCVNPGHLEEVSRRENTLRGIGPPAFNVKKTHCPRGHPFFGDNLLKTHGSRPWHRWCKKCHCETERRRREKKRLALQAGGVP
jgi:hypothetical protein